MELQLIIKMIWFVSELNISLKQCFLKKIKDIIKVEYKAIHATWAKSQTFMS